MQLKALYFPKGTCAPSDEEEEECRDIVETLEKIDTILDEHGIVFVKTAIGQLEKAKENWIRYLSVTKIFSRVKLNIMLNFLL